jgi:hypothetical protein
VKTLLCMVLLGSLMSFAAPAATDITGKWDFAVETQAGSGSPKFEFKQDGEKLTGSYEGQLGSAKLLGTVKGDAVEFKFSVEMGEVTYSGAIQADGTLKGKVKLGDLGEGTFTGKRAAK